MQPLAKDVWHLGEPIADGGRGEKIYEYSEALSGETSDRPLEGRPGNNKNPLIGSLSSAATPSRARRFAIPLIATRRGSHSPMPPPAVCRLPTTISRPCSLMAPSIRGSAVSSHR